MSEIIVSGGDDGRIRFWDVNDGSLLREIILNLEMPVMSLAAIEMRYEGEGNSLDLETYTALTPSELLAKLKERMCLVSLTKDCMLRLWKFGEAYETKCEMAT